MRALEDKNLITTKPTMISTTNGTPRNGTLLYTILPIQSALDCYNERQMALAHSEAEMEKLTRRLEKGSGEQQAEQPL